MGRRRPAAADPFGVLGLAPSPDVTDEDVRAAWRRIAGDTHPDREDGGDPDRFAVAAAAYTTLRTRFGRGETLADLGLVPPSARVSGGTRYVMSESLDSFPGSATRLAGRVRRGRPLRLALRILVAAAASAAAVLAAGPHPAAPALVTGVATWLIVAARQDLAPRGG